MALWPFLIGYNNHADRPSSLLLRIPVISTAFYDSWYLTVFFTNITLELITTKFKEEIPTGIYRRITIWVTPFYIIHGYPLWDVYLGFVNITFAMNSVAKHTCWGIVSLDRINHGLRKRKHTIKQTDRLSPKGRYLKFNIFFPQSFKRFRSARPRATAIAVF